jgi:hypothetical protein
MKLDAQSLRQTADVAGGASLVLVGRKGRDRFPTFLGDTNLLCRGCLSDQRGFQESGVLAASSARGSQIRWR